MKQNHRQRQKLQIKGEPQTREQRMLRYRKGMAETDSKHCEEAQLEAGTEQHERLLPQEKECGRGHRRQHIIASSDGRAEKAEKQHQYRPESGAGAARQDPVGYDQKRRGDAGCGLASAETPQQLIDTEAQNRQMQAGDGEDMGDAVFLIEGSDIFIHRRFVSRQQCAVNAGVLRRQQLIEDRSHPKSKRLQPSCKGLRIPSDDPEGGAVHRTMYGYRPIVQTKIKLSLVPRRFRQ